MQGMECPRLDHKLKILAALEHCLKPAIKRMAQGIMAEAAMGDFIHRENLVLFKKRLAEAHDATTH